MAIKNVINAAFPQIMKTSLTDQGAGSLYHHGFGSTSVVGGMDIADALVRYRVLKMKAKMAKRTLAYSVAVGAADSLLLQF